jgi:hypothetical protein
MVRTVCSVSGRSMFWSCDRGTKAMLMLRCLGGGEGIAIVACCEVRGSVWAPRDEEVPADEACLARESNSDAYEVSTVGGVDTEPARIVAWVPGCPVSSKGCRPDLRGVVRGQAHLSAVPRTAAWWMFHPVGGADLESRRFDWHK